MVGIDIHSSLLEMHEDATEVLVVLLNAMIQRADMFLIQEAQHFLLELPAALARNDFNQSNLAIDGLSYDAVKFHINQTAAIINIMQIEREFSHSCLPVISLPNIAAMF